MTKTSTNPDQEPSIVDVFDVKLADFGLYNAGAFVTVMVMNPVAQNQFAIAMTEDSTPINRIPTTVDRGQFFFLHLSQQS